MHGVGGGVEGLGPGVETIGPGHGAGLNDGAGEDRRIPQGAEHAAVRPGDQAFQMNRPLDPVPEPHLEPKNGLGVDRDDVVGRTLDPFRLTKAYWKSCSNLRSVDYGTKKRNPATRGKVARRSEIRG